MVGHLDDQLEGQASELHVQVDELHRLAEANAEVAQYFGEAPAQSKACEPSTLTAAAKAIEATRRPEVLQQVPRSETRASGSGSTTGTRPVADCGNGNTDCKDNNDWVQAWTEIKG